MTLDIAKRQASLPASIPLFRYISPRRAFDPNVFDPAKVVVASDLPPYLVLGPLDESSFLVSATGWSARWCGAENDTWLQLEYLVEMKHYRIRQMWCGVEGAYSMATAQLPLARVVAQVAYARFPIAWERAAQESLERTFQLRYVEPPKNTVAFCGMPDGAFRTIAFPVAIQHLRAMRERLAAIAAAAHLAYPLTAEAKLVLQAINYVEGKAPDWTRAAPALVEQSVQDTGTVPQDVPVRESAADGSSAWTLRRCVYVLFVTVPFAGLKDLLQRLLAADGPVRGVADPGLRFELQPLVVPLAFEVQSQSVSVWDADQTTRSTLQFGDPFGRPADAPSGGADQGDALTEARLLEAERISVEVTQAMRRVLGEASSNSEVKSKPPAKPSWLGFPTIASWRPFCPRLVVSAHPDVLNVPLQDRAHLFGTDSLARAIRNLAEERQVALLYQAFPIEHGADVILSDPQSGRGTVPSSTPRPHVFTHELSWPILRPGRNRPVRILEQSDSLLWGSPHRCHAYFALVRDVDKATIRLTVGGFSGADCIATWMAVGEWVRELYRAAFPSRWVPKRVRPPGTGPKRAPRKSPQVVRNDSIRAALVAAARQEGRRRPFDLSGRGHEPRLTLDPRLAGIVRSISLPSVTISGYGANNYYPRRVFKRAAAMLKRKLGWSPIGFSDGRGRAFLEPDLGPVPPTDGACE